MDARDRSLDGRGVLSTPPFVGPFRRSVGAQWATKHWHNDPLTPMYFKVVIDLSEAF